MHVVDYPFLVLFGCWLVLTVVNNLGGLRKKAMWVLGWDFLGLVPVWTFFAPNPGDTDLHLLYRDRDVDGHVGVWRELQVERRRFALDVWQPLRRVQKGIVDVAPDVARIDDPVPPSELDGFIPLPKSRMLGFPYILLLHYVSQVAPNPLAASRQFALARTAGFGARSTPDIMMISGFHNLEVEDGAAHT